MAYQSVEFALEMVVVGIEEDMVTRGMYKANDSDCASRERRGPTDLAIAVDCRQRRSGRETG